VELSDELPFAAHHAELARVPGLLELAASRGGSDQETAFWAEVVLEGLHQAVKLARQDLDSRVTYKEMLKFQLLRPPTRRTRGGGPTGIH
jgi:hypothetical protein